MKSNDQKILFVDDEQFVLDALRRQLKHQYSVEIALGGEAGLEKISNSGPFAVVVADMRMPGMNGIEFLKRVQYASPRSIRLMLTGNADRQTAVEAVEIGQVFHFLTKPCDEKDLTQAIDAALELYDLEGKIDGIKGSLHRAA